MGWVEGCGGLPGVDTRRGGVDWDGGGCCGTEVEVVMGEDDQDGDEELVSEVEGWVDFWEKENFPANL